MIYVHVLPLDLQVKGGIYVVLILTHLHQIESAGPSTDD